MSNILSIVIIWCDVSFENDTSYQPMKDEFNETTTATSKKPPDPLDVALFNDGKEELRSNDVPLITVRTADDAMREIKNHKDTKTFIICSGTLGRYLIPEIMSRFCHIQKFYVYTQNIALHMDLAEEYPNMLRMFDFPTNLLVRLTRDISAYFIDRGKMFLSVKAPQDALVLFNHAQKLEIAANIRERMPPDPNSHEPNYAHPDFRDRLNLLEGEDGLICQAEKAIREEEYPFEDC